MLITKEEFNEIRRPAKGAWLSNKWLGALYSDIHHNAGNEYYEPEPNTQGVNYDVEISLRTSP